MSAEPTPISLERIPSLPLADHVNHTPFPSQYFQIVDQHAQVFHVIAMRVTLDMHLPEADGTLRYAAQQTELCTQDVWSGEINESSPLWESDFAPYKPKCDVLIANAVSRPPLNGWYQASGQITKAVRWACGASLSWQNDTGKAQSWSKKIGICGPRRFGLMGISDPETASQVSVDWTRAYGGDIKNPTQDIPHPDGSIKTAAGAKRWDTHQANPVGCGFDNSSGKAAPQIEVSHSSPFRGQNNYPSVGLSATGKAWLPRRALAGTYDAAWQKDHWPLPPLDHDFAYWNCAPVDQQIEHPYSHVQITLNHLYGAHQAIATSSKAEVWTGKLPLGMPTVLAYYSDIPGQGQLERMSLDTITLDLAAQTVTCTFRYTTPAFNTPHLVLQNDMSA